MAARRPPRAEFAGRSVPGYSEERLRAKLARHALAAGREVVEKALWLYYALAPPRRAAPGQLTIYAALAYFILPLDAIPDFTPLAGYSDDPGVLSAALLTLAHCIDDEVKEKTPAPLQQWFGPHPRSTRTEPCIHPCTRAANPTRRPTSWPVAAPW
ncbi:MAG: DUF1232 domain-containing protein [Gammaproteobacteria bacterium]|nr:DUF1232 domain-containing protein [Gammaproteobacteria bacterium]